MILDGEMDGESNEGSLVEALRECVEELGGSSKKLLTERYLEGVSVKELELKTGRRYSALTMQLHRIRASLAICIEKKIGFVPGSEVRR